MYSNQRILLTYSHNYSHFVINYRPKVKLPADAPQPREDEGPGAGGPTPEGQAELDAEP